MANSTYNNANAIINNNAKNGNFYNANGQQMIGQNEWQRKQRILRVKTDEKFTLKYQINTEEGQVIVDYINKARAVIARGEATNLPIASGMNQIKWKRSLALEAVKLLGTSQNRPVNILDLEVVHLIAGGYGQGADASDYGTQQNGDDEQQSGGYGYRNRDYEYFSSLDKNFIELKATDVLLMTVKNYLEMFMGQKGLNCDMNSCKATCKVPKRNREVPIKREDENPSEYFCYPYELIYDHTHSIGCAVHFETKRKTEFRGKLVCIMSTQHGHKKMLHHHNVFKVGSSCSNCERNFMCNAKSRLCVKRDEERRRPPNVRGAQRRQNAGPFIRIADHWFYNYGQRIKRIGMSVIKAAELEEQRMNEVSSMVRQAIELPILSNEAYINLCFEVDFHNNNTAYGTEPMVDTTFSEASAELLKDGKSMILEEPTIGGECDQVQTASSSLKEFDGRQESKPKKKDRCSSVRRTTVAGKSDAEALGRNVNKRKIALDQGGKQNSSKKVALSNSVAKKGNSLSGQETISKKGKLNQSMNRGRALVGKHADFNDVKETTTVHATEEGGQMVVDGTPQQMRTNRVRGNTDENGHSKAPVKAPRVPPDNNVQNKYMALRMNMPFLMQQKNSIGGGVAGVNRGRGVRKQTYASAYQTEASSAAESDSGNCDDILFSSIAGEEEELPLTLTERKAAAPRRVGGGGGGVQKKFLEFGDTFVSSSPNLFAHNDIVRVEDSKFPGRVIDIRMRAIDFEDEEDDDVDGVGGGRSNFGVGRHFIDHALATKPKENETGQQPFTLILFFDKNSTCKWVPNGQIRLLYELDLNNAMLHREKDEKSPFGIVQVKDLLTLIPFLILCSHLGLGFWGNKGYLKKRCVSIRIPGH